MLVRIVSMLCKLVDKIDDDDENEDDEDTKARRGDS